MAKTNPNTWRAFWQDYRRPWIYLITINKAPGIPPFSQISETTDGSFKTVLTPVGKSIDCVLSNIGEISPKLEIWQSVIMPDHVHLLLRVNSRLEKHLSIYIGRLKGRCSRSCWNQSPTLEGISIFEDSFNDRILMREGQLENMRNYVMDNPRRRGLKMKYPDLFRRKVSIIVDGEEFEAMGNIFLLEDFDILAVRISRSFTVEQLHSLKSQWKRTVENGGILIGPMISPAEKRVRDWALDNNGRVIFIHSEPFGPRYKPPGRLFDLCVEGRILLLAPVESYGKELTRATALHLNDVATKIAAGNFRFNNFQG